MEIPLIIGILLLFVPGGTAIGVIIIIATVVISAVILKVDAILSKKRSLKYDLQKTEEEKEKRKKYEFEKAKKDLKNDLARLEEDYLEKGKTSLEWRMKGSIMLNGGDPYIVRNSQQYKVSCKKSGLTPAQEIIDDWLEIEKKHNEHAAADEKKISAEAKQHKEELLDIVKDELENGEEKDEISSAIIRRYHLLEIETGRLKVIKLRGVWRIKVVSETKPHLDLEYEFTVN